MATKKPTPLLTDRIPPHSEEAERGVLASMLVDPNSAIPYVTDKVSSDDFHIPAHQTVFAEIISLHTSREVDLITLTQHLRDRNVLEAVGGASFVTYLSSYVPTSANVRYYVEIVKDKRILRDIITTATQSALEAHDEQDDVPKLLSKTQLRFAEIQPFNVTKRKTVPDYLQEKLERMEHGEPDSDMVVTRFRDLDRVAPIRHGDMPCIYATRKKGKSTFALSIMENVCIANKSTGVYFSLEDRTSKVVDRLLAGVSRIPMNKHHVKQLSDEEIKKCLDAIKKICSANFIVHDDIYDLPGITTRAKKDILDNGNVQLIVVDYCQLVRAYGKKNDSKEMEVASISRSLRMLAMETGVPVIIVSQENESESTRYSKAIEQDSTHGFRVTDVEDEPNQKRIEIPFQRNGESGIFFDLAFNGAIARMDNLAKPTLQNDNGKVTKK